ncbi:MAG TPA: hypothetical protein VIR38_04020 [Thalassobaculum sp.]
MTAEAILSKSVAVFVILAIVFGLCSWLAGQAAARSWRPMRLALAYSVLIAMADRFLLFALRDASLLDPVGFALALVMFSTITALAFRWNQMDMMISQYPWLYERAGPLSWRAVPGTDFGGASDAKAATD